MALISALTHSASFWVFLVVNVCGGTSVAVALWGEEWSERRAIPQNQLDLLPHVSELKIRRRTKRFFERLLLGGVVFEVVAAVITTVWSSLEVATLNKEAAELRIQAEPRADRLRQSEFKNLIRGKATGEIQIVYAPYNGEAAGFAAELYHELSEAGWKMMGFGPKPADLEPTWASPRPLVPEMFASIAIDSLNPIDEQHPRWRSVPLDTKVTETNTDMAVIHWDFSGPKPKMETVDRYHRGLPPAGVNAGVLADALERSGFKSERNVDTNLPPDEILVVIGAKE